MIEALPIGVRCAGAGLILLSILHLPIGRYLRWREDAARMAPVNAAIFHVHTLFICVVLVMMGLPCLMDPGVFLERTRGGAWLSWSFAGFWALRLYCQWFVYSRDLWRGKPFETAMHWCFTLIWVCLVTLFALCGLRQSGLI